MNEPITLRSDLLREQYTKVRHKSGLTVCMFPKELTTSYAILATRFGSVDNRFRVGDETDFITVPDGVAHFLEHKMFENEDGEDTFVKFSRTGANANAYTSFRTTAYLFSCTEKLYLSLAILLRSVFSPYFTEENVKKEQGIIAQEIRMGEDDPYNALQYGMLQGLYEKHSARIDIAGTVPSIMKITPEILYRCHRAFYNPDNMVLCVCGQAELDKVMAVVDEIAGETAPISVESVYEPESPRAFRPRTVKHMQVAKPLFCIGVKDVAISRDSEERMKKELAMQLLSTIAFGRSSAFYNRLYEEGLISPSFDVWACHNPAFSFFSVLGDSPDPEEVYRRFLTYTAELTEAPLPKEDFERCRRVLYAGFVKSFDSTEEIANNLAVDFALDGLDIFRYGELLREITSEDVFRLAKELFRPEA
ncbi:MAG: insulinase family protein, partial [Clostridia bacterium]|nr:insulinase family protein [Clostridia bacterium]